MAAQLCLLDCALSDLFVCASRSGKITLADRYGLMAALLSDSLGEEELTSIDRLLHATARGRIQVVDEISVVA